MKGVLECTMVTGSVDGDTFHAFVYSKLLPLLMPFNGKNPHSVVVMDNASIHHVDGIMDLITGVGALLFLSLTTKQDLQEWIHRCGIYNTN